ncbi:MAG: transposase, partial [Chloroflexi bacterium]|nr:transposase [Chloroflexota bacterium]
MAVQPVSLRRKVDVHSKDIHGKLRLDSVSHAGGPGGLSGAAVGFQEGVGPGAGDFGEVLRQIRQLVQDPLEVRPGHVRPDVRLGAGREERLCPIPAATPRGRGRPQTAAPGGEERTPTAALPPGLTGECADLVARLTAVQARIATIEAELVRVAQPLPAYRLLESLPGVGPTLAAILLAEIGDIAWDHQVQ